MSIRFRDGSGTKGVNLMTDEFKLRENPFRQAEMYNVDRPGTYVREMYGDQLTEFYKKFFLLPLTKDTNRQVIGAVWSTHTGDAWGKGFGKSMLMAEESRRINQDLGAAVLARMGVVKDDISENPILAGYCTFDQSKEVKTFAAALLDALVFVLESPNTQFGTVHAALRERICQKHDAQEGFESQCIQEALQKQLRRYRGLNVKLTHRDVLEFINHLCHDDTETLADFVRHQIGPRIKATQGFNFVHIFNTFVYIAGIGYIAYFVDQIENFAKWARNQDREIKVLRESMCQTSPTAEMASFIFQMHIRAQDAIEDWWNSEHLPSLDFAKPSNATRLIDLKGLTTKNEAIALVGRYLHEYRIDHVKPKNSLHPFTAETIEAVRKARNGNPRKTLETLGDILDKAVLEDTKKIDDELVAPFLTDVSDNREDTADGDQLDNPER